MSNKSPLKTIFFLKIVLALVLLFQLNMPAMQKGKNIYINFSDITFEKCNDPKHSHPPISQRDTPDEVEKLVNSDLNNLFIINTVQNGFDITAKIVFEKPKRFLELLLPYFPPARSPPFLEV